METISVKLMLLFKVDILLHRLLDTSNIMYDDLPDADKIKRLGQYDVRTWIDIVPNKATQKTLSGLGCTFKPTATGFLVTARAHPDNPTRPIVTPRADQMLEFEMKANNPGFGQFSAFPLPGKIDGQRAIYLFDNTVVNSDNPGAFPNLSLNPPVFSLTEDYGAGAIVSNGDNRFVAIRQSKGMATSNTTYWRPIPEAIPYANEAHLSVNESQEHSPDAFGLLRVHCGPAAGAFRLFDGQEFRSPVFNLRLRSLPVV